MRNFLKDMLLVLCLVCVCAAGRLSLLIYFGAGEQFPSFKWFLTSFRFDLMTAAYIALPSALLTVISAFSGRDFPRLRALYATAGIVLTAVLCVVNFCFFCEYNSQFNYWIFGIFFDDLSSIVNAILEDYPVFWIFLLSALASYGVYRLVAFAFGKIDSIGSLPGRKLNLPAKLCSSAAYALIFLFMMRGGNLWGRPMQHRDAAVEPSEFLNKLVPSAIYCLKSEISSFLMSIGSDGLSHFGASEADMPAMMADLFGEADVGKAEGAFEKYVSRTAGGSVLEAPPKRIFFIVGEGHSAWPLFEQYSLLGLMPQTRSLCGSSPHCSKMLSSGAGTMASVSSLVSGLPYCGLDVRGVMNSSTEYSIAPILKRLGYSTSFYYAGQSTWMRLRDFLKRNKFAEVVGGESMGDLYGTVEWGIRDEDMFDFILKRDIPENSFNMILTVSNHPPYDVDLKAEGCSADLSSENDVKLWHMWYADKEIGRFTKLIIEKYPDSVVVITGDHSARTLPQNIAMSDGDPAYVPAIFVGRQLSKIYKNAELSPGQHLDIIPTLVEMIAPKGFKYKSWGSNLLKPRRFLPAMTYESAVVDGKYLSFNSSACPEDIKELARKYFAVAYYKSMRKPKR